MPTFEGCVEAKEISLTRKGANQHAHVLVRKTANTPAPGKTKPKPENAPMPTEAEKAAAIAAAEMRKSILKTSTAIACMSDVTKAYFLGLGDDAQLTFLEKSAEDQTKEADLAKAAADKAAVDAEAAKSGQTPEFVALQKRFEEQGKEIDLLKNARVQSDLEKRAETEFRGYPGGSAAVIPLLKAYAQLDETARTASEQLLKNQCEIARSATTAIAGRSEEDVSKAAAAEAKIEKRAQEIMVEKKVDHDTAWIAATEEPGLADAAAAIG